MSLYQNTILKKQIAFNSEKISAAYKKLIEYFHNPEIQENIRKSKEEEWQEGFMRALFVNIFDYTFKPEPKYNLISEKKNETDGKKADGAILVNDEVRAVIELKDTKTTDLKQIQKQAFDYKNNHRKAAYVITSNFEKLRFYIENTIDYQEFNLFTLTQDEFAVLWICLAYENIAKDLPKQLKNESTHSEDQITKELYKEYSSFKRELYADMLANNTETFDKVICPLVMFKKSQKLLDRFLFILFAEDSGLLPPNSIKIVIDEWEILKELDAYKPLYDRFKKYFGYMNTGFKGKKYDVFPYNGGLFLPDEILDNISISDEILCSHLLKMSRYDFSSEVDVNILGHIFEHSLTEIEEITNEIITGNGKGMNPLAVSKRKKDGVFYTPKYITTYIVENTLGKLCIEKKAELEIDETEYTVDKNRSKAQKVKLEQKLLDYRNWLLTLTICDPACGSGAFLNAALDFLMAEHKLIDEMRAKIYDNVYLLYDNIENAILENNLYGVDINEESVEIAKLALWLRTAKPQRKLNSLNDNIKCGNSLISDCTVAGEKAFDWHKEFPQVFEKGGFDVVIGNPPYGATLDNKDYLKQRYKETSFGNIDSYKYFVQLGTEITKECGYLSYIMPDSYLSKEYFKDLRLFVNNKFRNIYNVKLGDSIFAEVNLPTSIICLQNKSELTENFYYKDISTLELSEKQIALDNQISFINETPDIENSFMTTMSIVNKENTKPLIEVYEQVMGVKVYQKGKGTPKQTDFELNNNIFISNEQTVDFQYPFVSHGIQRYYYETQDEYIRYGKWLAEPRELRFFTSPKIVIREIVNTRIFATYIEQEAVVKNIAAVVISKDELNYPLKFLLALINSKLINYYVFEQSSKSSNKSYPSFNSRLLKNIPIKDCSFELKNEFCILADKMLFLNSELQNKRQTFLRRLSDNFADIKITGMLERFDELDFKQFIAELKKQKISFSLKQQDEWEEYFNEYKAGCNDLVKQIDDMDREIDVLVYGLYELTEEEVKIIDGGG